MEKFKPDTADDIAKERFKGTGPMIASAGYMYISHGAAMVASALGLGTLGFHYHENVAKIQTAFENFAAKHGESSSILKRWPARFAEFIPNFARKSIEALPGSKRMLSNPQVMERASSVVFAGGMGALGAWLLTTVWGIAKGAKEGNTGKRQFERAKAEIEHLRETNDDLNKINDRLHAEVVEASTRLKDTDTTRSGADANAPTTTSSQIAHEGTLQPERNAEAAIA